jgi:hypothetical protein
VLQVLDWVREMYAFDVAVAAAGVKLDVKRAPASQLMAQPPQDTRPGAPLYHYTCGPCVASASHAKTVAPAT